MSEPTRVVIRLKHSLPAGTEINSVPPDTLGGGESKSGSAVIVARGELQSLGASTADRRSATLDG